METRSRDEVDIYDLTVNVDLGWATLTSITSQFDREAQSVTGLPSFLLSILDRFLLALQLTTQITLGNWPAVGPTGFPPSDGMNIVGGGFNHLTQTDRFIQEFRLVSPSDQPLRWTAGIFYKSSKDSINVGIPVIVHPDRPYLQEPFDLIFDTPVNKYANELKELAVYGEVNYDMSETVEITLGARISKPEQKIIPAGGTSVFTETPLGDLDLEYDETWVAPKLVVAWRPIDGLLTYASYAKGFRPGNANLVNLFSIPNTENARAGAVLAGDDATVALADRDLAFYRSSFSYDGDELDSFEIGGKWVSPEGRFRVSGALYRMEWSDMIVATESSFVPITGATPVTHNANSGDAVSQGLEVELSAHLINALTLRVAGDLNDTEFTDGPIDGESFAFAPEYSLSVMLDYDLRLTDIWSATFHIDHARVDEQAWSNSYGTTLTVDNGRLPSYYTTNARVTLRDNKERWRIVLFARNLTGEENLLSRNANGGSDLLLYSTPRAIGLEVGWRL